MVAGKLDGGRPRTGRHASTAMIVGAVVALFIVYTIVMHSVFSAPAAADSEGYHIGQRADAKAVHDPAAVPHPGDDADPPTAMHPWVRKPGRRYVWIDVTIDGVAAGRVTAELYMDIVPKTAENFRGLVTGDNARGFSYKGSRCHRILANFVVQCGDWERGNGTGGKSIYGGDFEDEKAGLALEHSKRYVLQMANAGPNTNGAQFCFMLAPQPHLNGHHVVFGEVVDGFEVVDAMEATGIASDSDKLARDVVLADGGELFFH
ncbi:hypothetical protein SPRG_00456 [Saprolegnia parasitica CBS 223.65]|uniref:Peptidyl-prolyl cis-trans isomerase n=1 Tax=Saprolegnia parasitica (strain CBS 223.65) TaxID=695850 RepID=A0A067D9D7_SAPPC|nr:hypothetical protein SPRG_00456 [Saprolegnia parasitica CBS 223.65]KDO35612.1 hypothetical protein SPRG_00456 [Saprolegnia parasitica CBS 223.65]|eukprot:XP_012193940.1 hypothetical protein SPRG_00456 [Saprolegnia parasitica CBS 223.65]